MPVPTDITAGTLTITNGSTAVTGVGTSWLASDLRQGDIILWIEGGDGFQTPILADVPASNTALTLVEPWEGPTLNGVRYRIRYQWDSSRVSAQSRQLIELLDNGNILALASLTGPGVPVFDGPHSMTIRPTQDFINGVAYDVQVDTLPDRAAYDGQAAGFSVLVSDVGDGRSAVYSKASNTSGDWTDPAYVTGPIGNTPDVEATVVSGPPGSTATVNEVPIPGGVRLDFTLPSAEGFYWQGAYDPLLAYDKDSVVRRNGSSFVALQTVPVGEQPSASTPPVDTTYWAVLAVKGNDGAGTVTALNSTTGVTIDASDPTMPIIGLEPFGVGDIGAVPAPNSGDVAAGRLLSAGGTWVNPPANADLEFTVAQMIMRLADIDNVAQFLGPSGNRFADSYDALTYVDVAGAINLDTSVLGVLKATINTSTALANLGLNTSSSDWSGFNVRQVFSAGALAASGPRVRLRLRGPTSGTCTVAGLTIGHRAASGDAWDMAATPVTVTIGGGSTFSLGAGENILTDWINFSFDQTRDFVCAFYQAVSSTTRMRTGIANANVYFKSGANEIATANVSGYSVIASRADLIEEIQVSNGSNDLQVRSASFAATSAPSKAKAMLNVREVEAAAANTDYFIDLSRDGGTSWTNAPLTERYSLPSGLRVVESSEVDLTVQPSGIAPRYRIRTGNNKNVEFHDVYFYWS